MATRIQAEDLEKFCVAAMTRAGISQEDAELSAHVFVKTDTWGTFTHGTRQLRGLMTNARSGRLDGGAREKIVSEGPSWAIVDARDGMPPSSSPSPRRERPAWPTSGYAAAAITGPRGSTPT